MNSMDKDQGRVLKEFDIRLRAAAAKELGMYWRKSYFRAFKKSAQRLLVAAVFQRLDTVAATGVTLTTLLTIEERRTRTPLQDVIDNVITEQYPNHRKGGAAAGRVASRNKLKESQENACDPQV